MTPRYSRLHLLLFVALALGGSQSALGELPLRLPATSSGASSAPDSYNEQSESIGSLREDRESIHRQITQTQLAIKKQPEGAARQSLARELELLKWLDSGCSRYQTTLNRYNELVEDSKQADEDLHPIAIDTKEINFLQLDELRDQVLNELRRVESIELEIDTTRAALDDARTNYQDVDAKRRLAREAANGEDDPQQRIQLQQEYRNLELASRAHALNIQRIRLELKVKELELSNSTAQHEYLQQQIDSALGNVRFSKEDLQAKFDQIAVFESELRRIEGGVQQQVSDAERQWAAAKKQREATSELDPVLDQRLTAWKWARELRQENLSFIKQVGSYVGHSKNVWRIRFELANRLGTKSEFRSRYDDVATWREEVARFQKLIGIRVDEHLGDASRLKKRVLLMGDAQDPSRPWVEQQLAELDAVIESYSSLSSVMKAFDRMLLRFEQDLRREVQPTSARQRLAYASNLFHTAWDYELTVVDDQPVTIGKVIFGVTLWALGFLISRSLSRLMGRRILPGFGLTSGASQAFQSIAFYLMLTVFACVALEMINVPLTVFAFLGGAVAIGVGFGSQNILNNFISGLIVLAERPIRVGDLVEIGGLTGTIERIGARSTRVKTGANLEIIVPNSSFLENNVTNWTLSDTRIRSMVSVGVAYGSPTQQVSDLLRKAVLDHPKVIASPEPIILFKEFGDNSLGFEIHFWLHLRTMMDAERVSSDVRHRIDSMLSEANIVIAFPQRDVHLDATAPIEVNLRQIPEISDIGIHKRSA